MKKITLLLLFCALLGLGRVAAQSAPPSDSVRLYLDHMFAPLDKAQVPTPYLAEYGNRFAPRCAWLPGCCRPASTSGIFCGAGRC